MAWWHGDEATNCAYPTHTKRKHIHFFIISNKIVLTLYYILPTVN